MRDVRFTGILVAAISFVILVLSAMHLLFQVIDCGTATKQLRIIALCEADKNCEMTDRHYDSKFNYQAMQIKTCKEEN
jgi:hypothetical protein